MAVVPALLAALAVAGGSPATPGMLGLADRVDLADRICVGRVVDVVEIELPGARALDGSGPLPRLRFARVEVERTLKGDPAATVLHHEVWDEGTCGSTIAFPGQRALLFLEPSHLTSEQDRARVRTELGELPWHAIGSGLGIVEIETIDGREVTRYAGQPESLGPERPALAGVVAYVEELVRFAPAKLAVHLRCRGAGTGDSFDLRLLPDGQMRLARPLGGLEERSLARLPEADWDRLRERIEGLVGERDRTLGDELARADAHRLVVLRSRHAALVLRQPYGPRRPTHTAEARRTREDAVMGWSLVLEELGVPSCADHAAR